MELLFLILFFIGFAIFILHSKSDLYIHEHDASIKKEIESFDANFKELENLEIDNKYYLSNDHIYNKN